MPTVAIVSNLPRLVDLAEQVDACDEVIRFSHCWGWGTWTGKKTTRWVERTEANERADEVFDQCPQLNEILPTIETAYVLYGMRLRGNWTAFKAERLLREHPYLDRKVAPIDCRPFCETTPGCYPTSGTAFLNHVLRAKRFPSWRRLLVNWDYAVICGHDFEYEKTLVNRWISEGHFHHMQKGVSAAVAFDARRMWAEDRVSGFSLMSPEERGLLLKQIPETGQGFRVVEIGSYAGATAAWVLDRRPSIHWLAVEPFFVDTPYAALSALTNRRGRAINIWVGTALEWFTLCGQDRKANLVVVDGAHTYEGCRADMAVAVQVAEETIVTHDYGVDCLPGVTRAVDETPGWKVVDKERTLAVLKKG